MPTNAVKIAISLPKEDFRLVEAIRKRLGISRSALIDRAIHYWLNKQRHEEMIRRYEEGYRNKPEAIEDIIAIEKAGLETWDKEEKW